LQIIKSILVDAAFRYLLVRAETVRVTAPVVKKVSKGNERGENGQGTFLPAKTSAMPRPAMRGRGDTAAWPPKEGLVAGTR